MAKLKSPLSSLNASGRLTSALTFLRRRFTNIVETTPKPKDAKSFAQLSWRHMYQKAIALWWALSAAEKQEWESLARPFHMTGFAYFISQALKPNPGLYLPLQGGKMAGEIDMDGYRIEDVPDPIAAQDPVTRQYFEDNLPSGGYTEGARVSHNASQAIANGTWTTIAFNTELYDTDTIHDNITNNSRLTCKTAGKYLIVVQLAFAADATGLRNFRISQAADAIRLAEFQHDAEAVGATFACFSTIRNLSINDFVETRCFQSSGGPLNLVAATAGIPWIPVFMMQRIG